MKSKKEQEVSVMRELGKAVEKNVSDIKNQVAFLYKPPGKKQGLKPRPPDNIQVGSILLCKAHIFYKDILLAKGGNGYDAVNATSAVVFKQSIYSLRSREVSNSSNCQLG